jgi:hypothetical protein
VNRSWRRPLRLERSFQRRCNSFLRMQRCRKSRTKAHRDKPISSSGNQNHVTQLVIFRGHLRPNLRQPQHRACHRVKPKTFLCQDLRRRDLIGSSTSSCQNRRSKPSVFGLKRRLEKELKTLTRRLVNRFEVDNGILANSLMLETIGLKPKPTNRPIYPLTLTITNRENPRNIFKH